MIDFRREITKIIYTNTKNKHFTETVVASLQTDDEIKKMYDYLNTYEDLTLSKINRKALEITAKRLNINI